MPRIEKQRAIDLTLEVLRSDLKEGRWQDKIPGLRVLSAEFGVSIPTLAAALSQLSKEGWLKRMGARRSYLVGVPTAQAPPARQASERLMVFLTHVEPHLLPYSTFRAFEEARAKLLRANWKVELRNFDYFHAKGPHRSWDQLVPNEPTIPMVAVWGLPSLEKWAEQRGQRIAFLGGFAENPATYLVEVQSALLVREAAKQLCALGHQRIVMPLCDRPTHFAESLKKALRTELEKIGATFVPSYHTPQSDFQEREVVWRMAENAFTIHPPTAFLILDWKELVTIQCFLAAKGLKIPQGCLPRFARRPS